MSDVKANDVIQLDPAGELAWGPLLCVVEEVKPWGVKCYALIPTRRGEQPHMMWMRVEHGAYAVVGPAAWAAVKIEIPT
jgi:hypothetical protein